MRNSPPWMPPNSIRMLLLSARGISMRRWNSRFSASITSSSSACFPAAEVTQHSLSQEDRTCPCQRRNRGRPRLALPAASLPELHRHPVDGQLHILQRFREASSLVPREPSDHAPGSRRELGAVFSLTVKPRWWRRLDRPDSARPSVPAWPVRDLASVGVERKPRHEQCTPRDHSSGDIRPSRPESDPSPSIDAGLRTAIRQIRTSSRLSAAVQPDSLWRSIARCPASPI